MKVLVEQIQAAIEVFATNSTQQLEKGNKTAGIRARKSTLELEKLMKEFRKVSMTYTK